MLMLLMPLPYCYADNIRIGVLANKGIENAKLRWGLTANYLQNKIPIHSFSIVPLTFEQVEPAVNAGDIEFLITNPAMYVEMEAMHGASRIITLIDNNLTQFGGVIFCRSDRRDIQTINDLKGRSFMAVEKDSLGGWLMAWGELKQHGINPFRNFAPMLFAGNHNSVVLAVRDGKVDAGTVRTDTLERLAKKGIIKLSDFRAINEKHYKGFPLLISTSLYPEWPLAKVKHTSEGLAKLLAIELLSMPPDSPANKAAGIGGWTIPLDYQKVHDLMKDLRFGPYKEYGLVTWQQVARLYWHWFLLVLIVLLLMGAAVVIIYRTNRKLISINLQRKKAEEELKKAHQENELILNSMGEGLVVMDQQGMITFFNPAASVLTGYEAGEAMGKNLHDLIHYQKPDGTPYPREECPMNITCKTGEISQIADERFWAKNGEPFPVEYLTTPIKQNEQIVGVVGVFRDISWQKQAEAELKKAHQQNETILNSIVEGLFAIDRDGKVIFVNPATVKLSGYAAEELVGRNIHELTHYKKADGSPYPEAECPFHVTLQDGKSRFVSDDVFWTKGGTPLPVAYLTNPVEEEGQIVGVVGSFRDITWRKQAEAALIESNDYLEKIFDGSAEGIGIVDSKGFVRKWNKAAEAIYGYTFKELQGKPAFELYADQEELAKMIEQLRRDGHVKNYEITMKRKDGSTFPCSLSIKVLRGENGKNMGSVTIARDLTGVKEKEAKLKQAHEQLQVLFDEANQRNRNMLLLQEMNDFFQSCQTSGEINRTIAHYVPQFFPSFSGGLYMVNDSKSLFEMTSSWGNFAALEIMFGQEECYSLNRTQAYLVYDSKNAMNCRHVSAEAPGSYLCVPMMALGEIMGIFHLRKQTPEDQEQMKAIGQFATTVAETMALALANLKLRETLRSQAIRDSLTGLFNRRYLEETLERELSRSKRADSPLGVIMMDLDHFKEYNDTYGHNAGDELLAALGHTIQEQMRREDIACRYGGEEFLLIMPGAPLEVAVERAQIMNESVRQLHTQDRALKPITISAGVAIFPAHGATGKDVIKAADAAMYQAKEEGRDRVVVAGCDNALQFNNTGPLPGKPELPHGH
jgi:diguanylate cyclase (GGDEF)-like protein/PAS domain S-box-containing protein